MENTEHQKRSKGGRPKKEVKQDQLLAVMCTKAERFIITHHAKTINLTVSEYLRTLGLNSKIDRKIKTLPPQVLSFTATLNHLAANMNQVAKKQNSNEELNVFDRAELQVLSNHIKQLAANIKNYLR